MGKTNSCSEIIIDFLFVVGEGSCHLAEMSCVSKDLKNREADGCFEIAASYAFYLRLSCFAFRVIWVLLERSLMLRHVSWAWFILKRYTGLNFRSASRVALTGKGINKEFVCF